MAMTIPGTQEHTTHQKVAQLACALHPASPINDLLLSRSWALDLIVQLEQTKRALATLHEIPEYQIREQMAIKGLLSRRADDVCQVNEGEQL